MKASTVAGGVASWAIAGAAVMNAAAALTITLRSTVRPPRGRGVAAPPLPAGWDPADPATWRFVSEIAVALPCAGRDIDAPIVGRRELVTAATDHGHAGDAALRRGMLPDCAAA